MTPIKKDMDVRSKAKVKQVIGRTEKIDLPDFNLSGVEAKIDTGAYNSSLHCTLIEVVKFEGKRMLRIIPLYGTNDSYLGEIHYFPYSSKKKVKNSSGKIEERYLIKTKVKIMDREFETTFSLTDRSKMRYPVLLGRLFLKGRFLVDVSVYDRWYKQLKKAKEKPRKDSEEE